jgi:HipA-like protein
MRTLAVYRKNVLAGTLTEIDKNSYVFRYDENYFANDTLPAISLTFPKTQQEFTSNFIFSFFSNMIAEGNNKKVQSQHLRIDENDQFGLLQATCHNDTIGNVTIKKVDTP